jgi:hypothetical protein
VRFVALDQARFALRLSFRGQVSLYRANREHAARERLSGLESKRRLEPSGNREALERRSTSAANELRENALES